MSAKRKIRLLLLAGCLLLMLFNAGIKAETQLTPQRAVPTIHPGRALWVWNTRDLVLNPFKRAELFEFAKAPKGPGSAPIKRLFLSAGWGIQAIASRAEQAALANFLIEAHQQGLTVDLLAGTPSWASKTLAPNLEALLGNLAKWQRQTAAQYAPDNPTLARFDGLQLDVEPYLLAEWPSQELFDGWVGMAEQVYAFMNDNRDLGLVFGLALPIWLDQEKYQFLHEPLQAASDYVALMDYRDTAARIIRDALNELAVADRLQRAVFVGVDTKQVTGDPPSVTFYEEGNAVMERELKIAAAEFISHPGFVGFAIHHYEAYVNLKP
ncbi:MAG TPA: hypothetical protein GXZ82_06610 [Firmicutes bacterium]|nr:hypothetical protein [Bacillota bacterium]